MAGELESDSVALERVREYEELPQVFSSFKTWSTTIIMSRRHTKLRLKMLQEADWESVVPLAKHWPSTGEIKFDGYCYHDNYHYHYLYHDA